MWSAMFGMDFLHTGEWEDGSKPNNGKGCPTAAIKNDYCTIYKGNPPPPDWDHSHRLYEFYVPFVQSGQKNAERVVVDVDISRWRLTGYFWYTNSHYGDPKNANSTIYEAFSG